MYLLARDNFPMCLLKLLVFVLLYFTSLIGYADNSDRMQRKLQGIVDDFIVRLSSSHLSAMTLSVHAPQFNRNITVHGGHTEFHGTKMVDSTSLFQIGGTEKLFIAVTLLQLEATEDLHFSLDDPLKKYLPQYPQWGHITVRQLLNMTSGIPDYSSTFDAPLWTDFLKNPFKVWRPDELVNYAVNKPLDFNPGEGWKNSNTNYLLAGMVISQLTHNSVEEEMKKRFLNNTAHINLPNTFVIKDRYPFDIALRMVHGYTDGRIFPQNTDMTFFSLSINEGGPNISNSEDILNWMMKLLTPDQILSSAKLHELLTWVSMTDGKPVREISETSVYSFGLQAVLWKLNDEKQTVYFYEGTTLGFRIINICIPKKQIYLVVAVNVNDEASALLLNDFVKNILEIIERLN